MVNCSAINLMEFWAMIHNQHKSPRWANQVTEWARYNRSKYREEMFTQAMKSHYNLLVYIYIMCLIKAITLPLYISVFEHNIKSTRVRESWNIDIHTLSTLHTHNWDWNFNTGSVRTTHRFTWLYRAQYFKTVILFVRDGARADFRTCSVSGCETDSILLLPERNDYWS